MRAPLVAGTFFGVMAVCGLLTGTETSRTRVSVRVEFVRVTCLLCTPSVHSRGSMYEEFQVHAERSVRGCPDLFRLATQSILRKIKASWSSVSCPPARKRVKYKLEGGWSASGCLRSMRAQVWCRCASCTAHLRRDRSQVYLEPDRSLISSLCTTWQSCVEVCIY